MSRLNPLSLTYPIDNEEPRVIHSPLGPHPGVETARNIGRVRAQRRCSLCRQTGHNRTTCPTVPVPVASLPISDLIDDDEFRLPLAVQPCPSIFNVPAGVTPKWHLRRIIKSFLEFTDPTGSWRGAEAWGAIFGTFVGSLTSAQVEEAILNPTPVIREVIGILYEIRPNFSIPAVVCRGRDYAKKITLVLDISNEENAEAHECFICCEQKCALKTGCGHEFCVTCVSAIIETGENKTSAPVCSFCRVPFTSLSTSDHFAYAALADFIKNL